MKRVLNQDEIDAMLRAARGATPDVKPRAAVLRWDVRQAGQIGREQLQAISQMHEIFARNLSHSIAAYLRIEFSAALVSAEHLTYAEFLRRIPEVTYLASCALTPVNVTALLQMDFAVALPLIEILLGGDGKASQAPDRQVTAIEEQILETVLRIICRELQTAWHALSLEFQFEKRCLPEQVSRLLPREEKTLCLSFEIRVAESRGTLNLMVPALAANALLRGISAGFARAGRAQSISPVARARLQMRLLQCPFRVDLSVTLSAVPVRDLARMSPGGILITRERSDRPALLRVADKPLFESSVVRQAQTRAAQLVRFAPVDDPKGRPGL